MTWFESSVRSRDLEILMLFSFGIYSLFCCIDGLMHFEAIDMVF